MKRFALWLLGTVVSFCFVDNAAGAVVLQTVDIGPYCNTDLQGPPLLGAHDQFPKGPVVFNGIPFSRPESGNDAWRAWYRLDGSMEGPRVLDIDVGIYGAMEVFALLNTFGGEQLPGTFASVQFYGAEGAFFEKHLDGDSDIRDYLFGESANNINGTSTVNVFAAGSGVYGYEVRLDMLRIVLPSVFRTQMLDTIRFVDNGGTDPHVVKQRLLLSGVTVATVPEPTSLLVWSLISLTIIGICYSKRRKHLKY